MDMNLKRDRETQDGVDTLWRVPKIGRRHRCNFYEADSLENDDNNTIVFEVSYAEAMRTFMNGKQAACYFGSALCAFCPSLLSDVKNALEEHGMDLNVIKLPSGADDAGLKLDDYEKYDPIEISTLIGSWLIMILKYDLNVDDSCIISIIVTGLAEELGVPDEKILALESHFQVPQVIAIRNAFCANIALKEDVKNFLFWLKERKGMVATMARRVCCLINWWN